MLKSLLLVLCTALAINTAQAQLGATDEMVKKMSTESKDTVAWIYSGNLTLGVNQGFLHNWQSGGEVASLVVNGLFSGFVNRLYHRSIWSNNLDLNYSLWYAYSNHFVPRKTEDRMDFTSKYSYRINPKENFFLTGLLNFRSQFTEGYDYDLPRYDTFPTSSFLSPAYLTLAAGLEYRKGTKLSLFLSPLAARYTFVNRQFTLRDTEGAFGVPYGETSRFELGAYFSGRYIINVGKNLQFKTRLDLYSNYLAKDKKDSLGKVVKPDNPGNVDILWDNLLTLKVNKFINVNIGATLIYDNDTPYPSPGRAADDTLPGNGLGWWQIKQQLTLGFAYKF